MYAVSLLALSCSVAHGLVLKPATDDVDVGLNMCIDGRIAPELILYSPARSSTSTFARNLIKSPGIKYGDCVEGDHLPKILHGTCPKIGHKEMHFYSHWDGSDEAKKFYLSHYPKCQSNARLVTADLSPFEYNPAKTAQLYGVHKDRLTFVTLVRNPVRNLQSFYYYEHKNARVPFRNYTRDILNMAGALATGMLHCRYLDNVRYADAFVNLFKHFSPSQLMVVPMQYNEREKDGMKRLPVFMWEHYGLPPAPADDPLIDRWNGHQHPSIDEDLDEDTLTELWQFMDGIAGANKIATILAGVAVGGNRGPMLYGYKGTADDVQGVESWLVGGW